MGLFLLAMAAPPRLKGQQSSAAKDQTQPQICVLPQQDQSETDNYKLKADGHLINTDSRQVETDIKTDCDTPETEAESPDGPVVRYHDGLLSVNSRGATLQAVLDKVRVETGITIDASGDGLQGRLFDKVGPAPLREALMTLLYGTDLNYILQSNSTDPHSVHRVVILSPEAQPGSPATPQQTSAAASDQPEEHGVYGGFNAVTEPTSATETEAASPMNSQARPSSIPGIPAGFDVQKAAAEAHKTTGEILGELQRQQIEILDAQTPSQ
jgi:hypothetical protein